MGLKRLGYKTENLGKQQSPKPELKRFERLRISVNYFVNILIGCVAKRIE